MKGRYRRACGDRLRGLANPAKEVPDEELKLVVQGSQNPRDPYDHSDSSYVPKLETGTRSKAVL